MLPDRLRAEERLLFDDDLLRFTEPLDRLDELLRFTEPLERLDERLLFTEPLPERLEDPLLFTDPPDRLDEPLHVQYSYDDRTVVVVNDLHEPFTALRVTAEIFDINLVRRFSEHVTVDVAPDGRTAVEQLRAVEYDLLITDLKMPGMDGLSVIREARRLFPELPVIIITGYSTEASAIEAINLGVSGYITKPFAIGDLVTTVSTVLGTGAPGEPGLQGQAWTAPASVGARLEEEQ